MTRPATACAGTTVVLGGREKSELRQLCASPSDRFNRVLLNAVGNALWAPAGLLRGVRSVTHSETARGPGSAGRYSAEMRELRRVLAELRSVARDAEAIE